MAKKPLRIIQLTDTHLMADPDAELLGVKTEASFRAVVDLIKQDHPRFDIILVTGDLSQDGSALSYEYLANHLSPFNVPVLFVPGNHDNPTELTQTYPLQMISTNRHLLLEPWQLILLDSQKLPRVDGEISQAGLRFLHKTLQQYSDNYTLIGLHHPPVSIGSSWLDQIRLQNDAAFWGIIQKHKQVKVILTGHVHQENSIEQMGCQVLTTPSTCFQFKRQSSEFAIEKLPPGYRWLNLYDDGRVETGINRVSEYIGHFEENAYGY